MLKRMLAYTRGSSKLGLFAGLSEDMKEYGKIVSQNQKENIVNVMTNEFPAGSGRRHILSVYLLKMMELIISQQKPLCRCC